MLAKKYQSEVISILNPFEGIYTLELKTLGRTFRYYPGQFLHLAIYGEYDGIGQWPESRCFSMQSNPSEDTIRITYSVKGAFTKQMEGLVIGSKVWLKLPYGDLFSQPHNKENTVFIAGGTGITPFLSLFKHSSFVEYKSPMLFFGLRDRDSNIFVDDLEEIVKTNNQLNIELIYNDESGYINISTIHSKSSPNSSFFISGPPDMIKYFRAALFKFGVERERILSDNWE